MKLPFRRKTTVEDKYKDSYFELIDAVESKYRGETRHQTALKYIKQAENKYTDNIIKSAKSVN